MNETLGTVDTRSTGSAVFIMFVCMMLYVINYADRTILSATLPLIKADLGLTDAQAGWLGTAYFIMVAVLTIPSSILVDRWSRKKSLALMALLWSTATWFTGLGRSFGQLMVIRGAVGVGEAGFAPGGLTYVTASFSEKRRSLVTGIFTMGAVLGAMIGLIAASHIAQADVMGLGWRAPYFFFAIPGVMLGILVLFTRDYSTQTATIEPGGQAPSIWKDVLSILKNPTFLLVSLSVGMGNIAVTGSLQFLPMYLMRTRGIDVAQASTIFAVMSAFMLPAFILTGIFADWWQKRRANGRILALLTYLTISAVAITCALLLDSIHQHFPALIMFTISGSLVSTLVAVSASGLQGLVPLRLRSLSMGVLILLTYTVGGFGPLLVGWLSDKLGTIENPDLSSAFWVLPIALLIGIILAFLGSRTYGHASNTEDQHMKTS
ncbi:MAG: MFS transporter [Desulfobacula sp.]|uniref:MFS transporter n=1 Tax=Desulfobacula sp. TaxID=2593537 RepID=UPI0025B9AB97|nr:MFS transporter [Desulfobacula sp.]MCD4719190.1 MFS transporter [Desulfobacula sp.]